MKQLIALAVVCCYLAVMGACNNTGISLDPSQIKMKADSIVQVQSTAIRDSANAACQERIQTQLVAKADSIVKAKGTGQ